MKAIVCRELGAPSVLRLEELPEPKMGAGQARVKINAAGLNFPDILTVEGVYQHKPALPFIAGFETAGEVIEVAPDVSDVAPGNRVMMSVRPGGFAEQAVADGSLLIPTPEPFDDVTAAAFRVAYFTAHHCLFQRGGVQPGGWVLGHGAPGGGGGAGPRPRARPRPRPGGGKTRWGRPAPAPPPATGPTRKGGPPQKCETGERPRYCGPARTPAMPARISPAPSRARAAARNGPTKPP